jgi:hypothetical protein
MPTRIAPSLLPRDRHGVRRARRAAIVTLTLLLLFCAAWSGLWYFIAGQVEDGINAAIAREAAAGRKLSCGSREIFGFPFRVAMRCEGPKLEIERPAGKVTLAASRLTGVAQAYDLGHVIVEAEGPLAVAAPGLADTELDWRSLVVSFVSKSGLLDHGDMVVEAPNLRVRDGQNMIASNAERLELHSRRDPKRPPQDDAVELSGKLVRLVSPVLDAVTGEASPADMDAEASISQAAALLPLKVDAAPFPLERWRLAGGDLRVMAASFVKAGLKMSFSGELALDELHRVSGHVDASVEGAEALLPRLGLPSAAVSFLKLNGGRLRLPLTMSNGRMAVGPISIARMIPLY